MCFRIGNICQFFGGLVAIGMACMRKKACKCEIRVLCNLLSQHNGCRVLRLDADAPEADINFQKNAKLYVTCICGSTNRLDAYLVSGDK